MNRTTATVNLRWKVVAIGGVVVPVLWAALQASAITVMLAGFGPHVLSWRETTWMLREIGWYGTLGVGLCGFLAARLVVWRSRYWISKGRSNPWSLLWRGGMMGAVLGTGGGFLFRLFSLLLELHEGVPMGWRPDIEMILLSAQRDLTCDALVGASAGGLLLLWVRREVKVLYANPDIGGVGHAH